jgi:hypothetical protein
MKRFLLIFTLALIVFVPVAARPFTLSSINFSFEIPDTYTFKDMFIPERYQYFAAYHPTSGTLTFVISSIPDSSNTQFDSLSDARIIEMGKSSEAELRQYGVTVYGYEVKTINGHKYLLTEMSISGLRQIQYQIMIDGKATTFSFTSDSFTSKNREEVEKIMKTVKYVKSSETEDSGTIGTDSSKSQGTTMDNALYTQSLPWTSSSFKWPEKNINWSQVSDGSGTKKTTSFNDFNSRGLLIGLSVFNMKSKMSSQTKQSYVKQLQSQAITSINSTAKKLPGFSLVENKTVGNKIYIRYKYKADGINVNGLLYYSIPDDYRIILVESEYIDDVSSEVSSITKSLGF